MTYETWEQVITWEWCRKCAISWHWGDKPLCDCESLEASQ